VLTEGHSGMKKKEEKEEIIERVSGIGNHSSHTWKCEEMEPFGRTHIICLSIITLLIL
jgi:CobQ-like glutamine amidotransferase family enzyme